MHVYLYEQETDAIIKEAPKGETIAEITLEVLLRLNENEETKGDPQPVGPTKIEQKDDPRQSDLITIVHLAYSRARGYGLFFLVFSEQELTDEEIINLLEEDDA